MRFAPGAARTVLKQTAVSQLGRRAFHFSLARVTAVLFAVLVLVSGSTAHAEPASAAPAAHAQRPLRWDFPTFRPAEYVATGALGAAAIGVFVFAGPQRSPRWTGGILFDDSVREAVRVRSPVARDRIRLFSDITGVSSLVWLLGVDSLLVPLWRGSSQVALQLLLLDAEAFALNGVLTSSMFYLSGRARPSYADCQRDSRFDPLCNPRDTASFWSGHTALAFTAAGLSCAHHAYVKLYGGGAPDTLACAGAIGLSATTGTLRLLGDRHYASDIFAGALVGFGIGYAVPTLLHYTQGSGDGRRVGIAVGPVERGVGVSAVGGF